MELPEIYNKIADIEHLHTKNFYFQFSIIDLCVSLRQQFLTVSVKQRAEY